MSINWVMVDPNGQGFVKLPNERILYTSPARTSLEITTSDNIPGAPPFLSKSDAGTVYITNQRLVYLPTNPTAALKSFSSPILNLRDTFIRAPFFGANFWSGHCKPVPGGGIPPPHPSVELKLTFRDGGAFDFHTIYEQIRERLNHAYSVAEETSQHGIDLTNIDLEPLPVYKSSPDMQDDEEMAISPAYVTHELDRTGAIENFMENDQLRNVPAEAPPDYEEMQVQAVSIDLEQRLRREAETTVAPAA